MTSPPLTPTEFAALLTPLGPWPRTRRVAIAVSGGADSLALAWLSSHWGNPTALIIDHALRPDSAAEAAQAAATLASFGVPAHTIRLNTLTPGPGLAARARAARYAALTEAAATLGLADLLLGHHAGDQAETVLMRRAAGSGPAGLAAMPAITERAGLRLIRPLLAIPPGRLRATLRHAGIAWANDPSNTNLAALRPRLRAQLQDPAGDAPQTTALTAAAAAAAAARATTDARIAETLAHRASLFPEGYARLTPGPIDPVCLAALIRALGGQPYSPAGGALARLAAHPRPATLGGIRLLAAGRLGPGLLLVREPAAIGPPVAAVPGAIWDHRFRLHADAPLPPGLCIAALGEAAAALRHLSPLPAAILRALPALKRGHAIAAIPHLPGFGPPQDSTGQDFTAVDIPGWTNIRAGMTFSPPMPAAGAVWLGDVQAARTHHVHL